jgi:hypothetical protein
VFTKTRKARTEVEALKALLREKDAVIQETKIALHEKDAVIQETKIALHEKDTVIQEIKIALHEKDAVIKEKDISQAPNLSMIWFVVSSGTLFSQAPVKGKFSVNYIVKPFHFLLDVDYRRGKRENQIFSGTLDKHRITKEGVNITGIETEAKTVSIVMAYIRDVLEGMGLSKKFLIEQEQGSFGLRPDMYLINTKDRNPIGVIEVKKPYLTAGDEDDGQKINSPVLTMNALGQINLYLNLLKHAYGVDHPIGILTTMTEFRICWLGDLPDMTALGERKFGTISPSDDDKGEETPDNRYVMSVSPMVSFKRNRDILNNVVATALFAMSLCKTSADLNPFGTTREFMRINRDSDILHVSAPARYEKPRGLELPKRPPSDCENLNLLKSLGVGVHGYTWLAASESGALCVLKFEHPPSKDGWEETIDAELNVWNKVHPELGVEKERWRGKNALVLPYFAQASIVSSASARDTVDENASETLRAVREELENFAEKGIEHMDVRWPNIGFFSSKKGELKAVLIDYGYVEKRDNWEREKREAWVTEMMQNLEREKENVVQ